MNETTEDDVSSSLEQKWQTALGEYGYAAVVALGEFVEDITRVELRKDLGEEEKKGQIASIGLQLIESLPKALKETEVAIVSGVPKGTVEEWRQKELLSPDFVEKGVLTTRGAAKQGAFQYSPGEVMKVLLVAAYRKSEPELELEEIDRILKEERDWEVNPNHLRWICYHWIRVEPFGPHFLRKAGMT